MKMKKSFVVATAGSLFVLPLCGVQLTVDPSVEVGAIKPMNCVNNGPICGRPDGDPGGEPPGNEVLFRELEIPYCRPHDDNSFMMYGSPYIVDITAVFPDFEADETKESSYLFGPTDVHLGNVRKVGSQPFFRLGQTFNFTVHKASVQPPKDFVKWARICEHVIAHYNEGWAKGFRWNVEYWEIWNEPDCFGDRNPKSSTWGGSGAEFDRFYEVAAKHLKARFPTIKIGGPALCWNEDWGKRFLDYQKKAGSPLDYFSWHIYVGDPEKVVKKALRMRQYLDERGFDKTASILNEWNRVKDWGAGMEKAARQIGQIEGAAFAAAVMCDCQKIPVDMLMYYCIRPSYWCGVFGGPTGRDPLKGYWAFWNWKELRRAGTEVKSESDDPKIHVVAAKDAEGRLKVQVVRHETDDNVAGDKRVILTRTKGDWGRVRCSLTDGQTMNGSPCPFELKDAEITLVLPPQAIVFVEEN